MSRKIQFIFLLILVGLFLTATQPGFAQSTNGPLNFGNNYFVSGDYVVGGAQGMNVITTGGYTGGTITIPDPNPGITGSKSVPPGAEVVAALLYWQTVEKSSTVPGQAGSGENGYFMPVFPGGPNSPGYPITGVNLASSDTVAYSSSGCTSTSTGEVVRTYRANVLAALPRDSTGNISANGIYEVYLPSVRNSTPLTLGATLVLIYRILSPSVPLNSIVIYDGGYAPSTSSLTMKQTMQGFYDAAPGPVSRITQIVGQGKTSKVETVYLNNTALPSLYGIEPAFPGYYGSWDNPTWTFNPTESYLRVPNPILAGAASATTDVVAKSSGEGCVSWGAVIVSTTVASSDGDGLLDAWKVKPANYANPGYCDASVNEGSCTPGSASWVDLPAAVHGEKDVFIQLDYMCSSPTGGDLCTTGNGSDYSFDPRLSGAVGLVTSAFAPASTSVHPAIHLHINPSGTNQPDLHAIPEQACVDNLSASPEELCAFPGQPGVVAWKQGFDVIKNQLVDPSVVVADSVSACTTTPTATGCIPRFQPGKRTSWHYVLSAHAVGQPKWKLQDDSLESVKQSGNTVTFTTATAVGTLDQVINPEGSFAGDPSCPYGRVTILGAATNPNLNGTFCLKSAANSTGTTFTITVGGTATTGNYTYYTDPNLAVAPSYTSSASGVSDVGGADSLITLGLWGNPALNGAAPIASPVSDGQSEPVLAGTFMHEIGHSIGLTHGGYTYPLLALGDYVPSLEPNCKPNFQSVMNYAFQVDLLAPLNGGTNVPDYSGQALTSLNKARAEAAGILTGASYLYTYWYSPYAGVGSPVTIHCDGSPNPKGAETALSSGVTSALSWAADQDINFDGNTTETLQGYNDWANIDLRQIGATGTNSTAEGGGQNFGGGGQNFGGGGQNFGGGGQNFGGGGQNFGGGGQNFGGGGQNFGGGGQNFGGGGEVDVIVANSVTRPPRNLTASEAASPRTITLSWNAPIFGQIGQYNVYQAVKGGAFSKVGSVSGTPPALTFAVTDTIAPCNATGYEYFVTAVLVNSVQESVGSNTVINAGTATGQGPLTGCYTNTPPTVALNNLTVTTSSVVQGTSVPITWSLQDDYNTTSAYVNRTQANSLVAIGPFPTNTSCPATPPSGMPSIPLLTNGVVPPSGAGASLFGVSAASPYLFTYTLDTTPLSAGCYWFTLTLDSGQTETTTSSLAVQIYVSTTMPHITTTALSAGTVGQAYSNPIFESGGVGAVGWSFNNGSLPSGMTLGEGVGNNGSLSGTTCVAGNYGFTAIATDSKGNTGKQALTLVIKQASTMTSVVPSLNASTYGQAVTFTATVTPQYNSCVPTGKVTFYDGASAISPAITLIPGTNLSTASFTTTVVQLTATTHSITAVYTGDSNFYATGVSGSTATALSQVVNKAYTTTSVMSSLNASTYGQSVTFSATVAPQYFGTPTGSVTFFDGATPISNAITLTAGTNLSTASFTTSVVQLTATTHSITAVYSDDSNFYKTGSGGSTATVLSQVVDPATLTAAVTGSQTYGGTSVVFVYGLSGFVGGQNSTVLTSTALICASNALNNSPVGNNVNNYVYMVLGPDCLGLSAPNYVFSYVGGAFVVNPAPLSITAASSDKTYDGTTSSTATPTVSGLLFTDSVTSLAETYDTPNTGTSKTMTVSTYTVNDGNNGANYTVLTVTNTSGEIDTAYSSDALLTDFTNPLTTYATFLASADLTSDLPLEYTASAAIIATGDRVYPNTDGATIVVQFPTAVSAIRVFPNIDHYGSSFDGYQYSISGSTDGITWVPLFDAKSVSNAGEPFTLASFTGTAPNVVNNVLTNAGSTGVGTGGVGTGGTVGYVADFVFSQAYLYYSFGPSTVATVSGNTDQELSGVAALPPPAVSDVTKLAKR